MTDDMTRLVIRGAKDRLKELEQEAAALTAIANGDFKIAGAKAGGRPDLSPAARARISAAQKLRWKKHRAARAIQEQKGPRG